MRVYGSGKNNLSNSSVNGSSQVITQLFSVSSFITKSANSTIYINFDANWAINGSGLDNWESELYVLNTDGTNPQNREYSCAMKKAKFSQDNRQCSITLFPISGIISNTSEISEYAIRAMAGASSSDDILTIGNFTMTIQEVQN